MRDSSDGRTSPAATSRARAVARRPPRPRLALVNAPDDRRFLLTNQEEYSLTYNGLVIAVEKRRSNGWQAFASYTVSRATGLQASGGASAAGAQVSTVAPPRRYVRPRPQRSDQCARTAA